MLPIISQGQSPCCLPEALFYLLKIVLLSVMPSCQGPPLSLNESHSISSHGTRPGPLLPQFTPKRARPGSGQLGTEMFAN